MSDPCTSLRTYLLGKPAITDLIGTRMFPGEEQAFETAGSSIVYHEVDGGPDYDLEGQSTLSEFRVQLNIYGDDNTRIAARARARRIAEAVRLAITSPATMGSDEVQTAHLAMQREESQGKLEASRSGPARSGRTGRQRTLLYRHMFQQDWILFLTESEPA